MTPCAGRVAASDPASRTWGHGITCSSRPTRVSRKPRIPDCRQLALGTTSFTQHPEPIDPPHWSINILSGQPPKQPTVFVGKVSPPALWAGRLISKIRCTGVKGRQQAGTKGRKRGSDWSGVEMKQQMQQTAGKYARPVQRDGVVNHSECNPRKPPGRIPPLSRHLGLYTWYQLRLTLVPL